MKDMIKKIREDREGFTLAELLIVVAIIAVLVAIAIPVFNSQLEKSRDAVTVSNVRTAYAEAQVAVLTASNDNTNGVTYTKGSTTAGPTVKVENVKSMGKDSGFVDGLTADLPFDHTYIDTSDLGNGDGKSYDLTFRYNTAATAIISIDVAEHTGD